MGGIIMNYKLKNSTTIYQSKRLINLGIKEKTSDHSIPYMNDRSRSKSKNNNKISFNIPDIWGEIDIIPIWTIISLIKIMPDFINVNSKKYELNMNKTSIYYINFDNGLDYLVRFETLEDKYFLDAEIDMIEWLIKNKFFNKEYLK